MNMEIFNDLFVLELANNHLGSLQRGKRIIETYAKVVSNNQVRASIKFQFRNVASFIHVDYQDNDDIRYIKKTRNTQLSLDDYSSLIALTRQYQLIPMATPFDEDSVDLCLRFDLPIIKIASSCINDWPLIEKIAYTKKPVIISTGGASLKDIDDIVAFFENRQIPLAINHCVSLYPTEDHELELNQIDFLKMHYPHHTIGFSTHEYHDWTASLMIAYAKGARTFERHIDINMDNVSVSPYCSLPEQVDAWFKAYHKVVSMCGASGKEKRINSTREIHYLDSLVRGIYARRDLPAGHRLTPFAMETEVYAAIPLLAGQISCRELNTCEVLVRDVKKDQPIMIEDVDSSYANNADLKALIKSRGLKHAAKN